MGYYYGGTTHRILFVRHRQHDTISLLVEHKPHDIIISTGHTVLSAYQLGAGHMVLSVRYRPHGTIS